MAISWPVSQYRKYKQVGPARGKNPGQCGRTESHIRQIPVKQIKLLRCKAGGAFAIEIFRLYQASTTFLGELELDVAISEKRLALPS